MKIRTSLRLTFFIVLFISILHGSIIIWSNNKITTTREQIIQIDDIALHIESVIHLAHEFLQHPHQQSLFKRWHQESQHLLTLLKREYRGLLNRNNLTNIDVLNEDINIITKSFINLKQLHQNASSHLPIQAKSLESSLHTRIMIQRQHLVDRAAELRSTLRLNIIKIENLTKWLTGTTSILLPIVVFLGFFWSERKIVKPISQFHRTVKFLAAGNYACELQIDTKNEIGELAVAFNAMAKTIKEHTASLENTNKQLLQQTKALQLSQDRLAQAEAIAHVGHCAHRFTDKHIYWSDELWRIFGRKPQAELLTYDKIGSWLRADYRDVHDKIMHNMSRLNFAERLGEFVYCLERPDGEPRWVKAFLETEFDEDHQPAMCFGAIMDITDHKKAANTLKELAAQFQMTFEQAAVGMAHIGLKGEWLRVNQKLCNITGYSRNELLGSLSQDIIYPDDLETNLRYVQSLIDGTQDAYAMEQRFICKHGAIIWVNVTVAIVRDHNARPDYCIAVIENIDARKQIESKMQNLTEELQRSNTELESFAYVASHDLKAPLRGIDYLAKWLYNDLIDNINAKSQRHLTLMRNRVQRMEALLDGLLQYSRIGRIDNQVLSIDTRQLLNDIISLLALPDTFTVNIAENLPNLNTQQAPLEMVLRNLINNAVKHHDQAHGCIDIDVIEKGQVVEFRISDDGPGIAPEFHAKIFGIFQTLKPRDEVEGSGMGLALVKKAVEYHGGNICIQSDPQQQRGTTFIFTWPKG